MKKPEFKNSLCEKIKLKQKQSKKIILVQNQPKQIRNFVEMFD